MAVKRRWRDFVTASGARPVKKFIDELSVHDRAEVAAAMKDVQKNGIAAGRHLRGEIYEVRAAGLHVIYRILFSREGAKGRVLLALVPLNKKSRKTPPGAIRLAERRLKSWRARGSDTKTDDDRA